MNERKSVLTATGLSLSITRLLTPTIHTAELIFFLQLSESIRAASYPGSVASWPKTKKPLHPTRKLQPQRLPQRGTSKFSMKPIVRDPVLTTKRARHQANSINVISKMPWPGYKKSTRLRRHSGGGSSRSNPLLPFLLHRQNTGASRTQNGIEATNMALFSPPKTKQERTCHQAGASQTQK